MIWNTLDVTGRPGRKDRLPLEKWNLEFIKLQLGKMLSDVSAIQVELSFRGSVGSTYHHLIGKSNLSRRPPPQGQLLIQTKHHHHEVRSCLQYPGLDHLFLGRLCAAKGLCSELVDGYECCRNREVHFCQKRRDLCRGSGGTKDVVNIAVIRAMCGKEGCSWFVFNDVSVPCKGRFSFVVPIASHPSPVAPVCSRPESPIL